MLAFAIHFNDSRDLCISAKNHCTSAIQLVLQRQDSAVTLLSPSALDKSGASITSMLPLEYAIQSTVIHRQSSPSLNQDEEQSLWCYRAHEQIAYEVVSLLSIQTIRAIQQLSTMPEHVLMVNAALARLRNIQDFCFEDVAQKIRALTRENYIAASALLVETIEAPASPVFTSLYDGLKKDAISSPIAEDQDELVRNPYIPKKNP